MPIRVNCRHCGKQFSAWDELSGQMVQCPKCQQRMVVADKTAGPLGVKPPQSPEKAEETGASELAALNEALDELPTLDELVGDLPADQADSDARPSFDPLPGTAPRGAQQPKKPPARRRARAPKSNRTAASPVPPPVNQANVPLKASGPAAVKSDDFDESDELPIICPNCSQPIVGGDEFCDACGYHRILKKVLDFEGVRRPDKATGFERVLNQQLADGESAEAALRWAKVVAGLGMLVLLVFISVCMGPLVALGCLVCLGGLIFWLYRRSDASQGTSVNRDVVSKAVWNGLLALQRILGWRRLEWPFPTTHALTMNDPGFTDDDFSEVALDTYQTLDLEGTQVSNSGLAQLEKASQLRFLVVRNTQVTAEGAQRLQTKRPRLMIWY